jgi:hypothetical protein
MSADGQRLYTYTADDPSNTVSVVDSANMKKKAPACTSEETVSVGSRSNCPCQHHAGQLGCGR